ncbi:MAG: hypothetical protein EKK40_14225 [Bradyrhizobiaceae bacterium]|nr:MAG: hypothetical protein EKK40_14225 [Bradyrhizobiaceae bacterium]
MKTRLIGAVATLLLLGATANAQTVTIDMRAVKCSQYLAMTPATSDKFSAWMSGWFSYQTNRTFVDLALHEKNVANVKDWCRSHQQASVMEGLQTTLGPK